MSSLSGLQTESSNLDQKSKIDDSKESEDAVCEDWEQLNQQVIISCFI